MNIGPSVDSAVVLNRLRALDHPTRRLGLIVAAVCVVAVPLIVSGPGNDLDVANTFRSGRSIARHGAYLPSRAPGAPVHESIVGVLDLVGGPMLTNLASLVAAVALLIGLDRLLAEEGVGLGRHWAVLLVAANPWFLVAATSTVDYLFALAFVTWSAVMLRRGHPVAAGVLAAAAMGSRIGTAVLVGAVLLAELTDRTEDRRSTLVPCLTAGAVAAVGTVMLFVPSVIEAGGLAFAQNDFDTASPLVHLGRAAVKNLTLLGVLASLVVLAALPSVARSLTGWRVSWLIRFAVPALLLSQVVFVRFPWKMAHLLPCLVLGALLLAVALADRPRLLMALVALQLLYAVVHIQVVEPDDPNAASSGRLTFDIAWGPLVADWQCRQDHRDAYLGRQKVEVEAAWGCAQPFDR